MSLSTPVEPPFAPKSAVWIFRFGNNQLWSS
jgi:hypothetical protein